jgi:hypothetical protein
MSTIPSNQLNSGFDKAEIENIRKNDGSVLREFDPVHIDRVSNDYLQKIKFKYYYYYLIYFCFIFSAVDCCIFSADRWPFLCC